MEWLHPTYLWALLLVPALLWFFVRDARWRERAWERFGGTALAEQLAAHVRPRRRWFKASVVLTAAGLLVLSLAGPRFGSEVREVEHEGIDLVVALDVSLSMKAEDVAPSRLDRSKNEVNRLLDELSGDRVGLVLFAYDAIIQSPLTTDYSALRLFLDVADPSSVPTQGTNFETAYETALDALEASDGVERSGNDDEAPGDRAQAILFVTDGEVHVGDVNSIREDARDRGVHLYAAGVGTADGARIPLYDNGEQLGHLHDDDGETVITRFEEESLRDLTRDGAYFRLGSSPGALTELRSVINRLEQTTFAEEEYESYREQYHWPLALALVLLILEPLIPVRSTSSRKAKTEKEAKVES